MTLAKTPTLPLAFAALLALAPLPAAAQTGANTGTGAGAETEAAARPKLATTFTVIADIARNVAGDRAEIVAITRPGAEIHGYEPTPQDLVRAYGADLVLYNGLGLEAWFEQFLAQLGPGRAVTLSDGIAPIAIGEGRYSGRPNPHGWMSPANAAIYIDNIAAALSELDPAGAETYAANAAAYKARLAAALAPARARIAALPEDHRWLVTCEGAFSYLARDLGLHEAYLWPINADQTGTPRQIKTVIDTLRAHAVPAVFCESTISDRPARQVAAETGARFGGVLYVDSLSEADGPVPSYLDLLRVTMETIATGLEGQP